MRLILKGWSLTAIVVGLLFMLVPILGALSSQHGNDPDTGCSDCSVKDLVGEPGSEATPEEVREQSWTAIHDRMYGGLIRGEQLVPQLPAGMANADATLVYFVRVSGSSFDPQRSFVLNVLKEWSRQLPAIHIVAILTGDQAGSSRVPMENFFSGTVEILVDSTGMWASAFRSESDTNPGYLLDRDQVVVRRLQPLRVENASTVRQQLGATTPEESGGRMVAHFPVIHPSQGSLSAAGLISLAEERLIEPVNFDIPIPDGRPYLLYLFMPDCTPCEAATEVTAKLAHEFEGQVTVLGLAHALSTESIRSATLYGERYAETLQPTRNAWVAALPRTEDDTNDYVDATRQTVIGWLTQSQVDFPVLIDWDRALSGSLGMGLAPVPCWALVDSAGNVLDILPGRQVVRYDENVEPGTIGTYPSIDDLRLYIEYLVSTSS